MSPPSPLRLQTLHERLEATSGHVTGGLALVLVAAIGFLDWLTGTELSSSVFYALPVGAAAWYAGSRWGYALSYAAAVVWYGADLAAGATYSAAWIPVWNAGVRLAFFVIIADLAHRLHDALDAQRRLAEADTLTGLANSRRFLAAVDAEVARASRYARPVTLAYVDLDGFKAVNDRWGHVVGDQVLARVGELLRRHVRATDLPARLGGDEFAVLLPETDGAAAREAVEKLRAVLEAGVAEAGWPVGFSIGVFSAGGDVATGVELIRRADALMYEVKRAGKGRTAFAALDSGTVSGRSEPDPTG